VPPIEDLTGLAPGGAAEDHILAETVMFLAEIQARPGGRQSLRICKNDQPPRNVGLLAGMVVMRRGRKRLFPV
jgi:hypothetical protein